MKLQIPIYIFLKAIGITDKKIIHSIKETDFLKSLIKKINNIEAVVKVSGEVLNKETNSLRLKIKQK